MRGLPAENMCYEFSLGTAPSWGVALAARKSLYPPSYVIKQFYYTCPLSDFLGISVSKNLDKQCEKRSAKISAVNPCKR